MRIIERRDLQEILVQKVVGLGGEVVWGRKVERVEEVEGGGGFGQGVRVLFKAGESQEVGLLVGAEGAWSAVRRHILRTRNAGTAEERWVPDFMGATGVYGISSPEVMPLELEGAGEEVVADTHGIWLDRGNLSTSPLPGGKIRWDLIIPEGSPPEYSKSQGKGETNTVVDKDDIAGWQSRIVHGVYTRKSTEDILRQHAGVYHPVTGTFGKLVAASERIIRSPLRQRVWEAREIQCGNTVLIGDAARLMLPSSGQGEPSSLNLSPFRQSYHQTYSLHRILLRYRRRHSPS
jgi:2-polyprenyl-6-methoxyphenol hydroxylase-like FAD-dependent oxidoreductase